MTNHMLGFCSSMTKINPSSVSISMVWPEKMFKLINVNRYGVGVVSLLCDGRRLYFFGSDRDEKSSMAMCHPKAQV